MECSTDVFEDVRTTCGEGDDTFVLQVGATFSSNDEPQESVAHMKFSSMVRPYLSTVSTPFIVVVVFSRKVDSVLFINGTTVRSLKVKQYYG